MEVCGSTSKGLSVHNEQQPSGVMSSGKKRPRGGTAWGGPIAPLATSAEEEKENKAPRTTRRQSSVNMLRGPGAAGGSRGVVEGVAQR